MSKMKASEIRSELSKLAQDRPPDRIQSNHIQDLWLICKRIFLQNARQPKVFLVDVAIFFVIGGLIAVIFNEITPWNGLIATTQAATLAVTIPSVQVALRIFGMDKDVYQREEDSGISVLSYFFGKFIGTVPMMFLLPACYLASYYGIIWPRGLFVNYYIAIFATVVAVFGLGVLISLIFSRKNMLTVAVTLLLVMFMTSGMSPTKDDLFENMGFIGEILYTISIFNYASEALTLVEYVQYPSAFTAPGVELFNPVPPWSLYLDGFGHDPNGFGTAVGNLFLHAFITFSLSLLYMYLQWDEFYLWRRFKVWAFYKLSPVISMWRYLFPGSDGHLKTFVTTTDDRV